MATDSFTQGMKKSCIYYNQNSRKFQRITDFEKVKLQYTNPGPFKARNVYFDLEGIERV